MWGNRLGWVISAALLLIMALVIGIAYAASSRLSPPTEFTQDPARLAEIKLPVNPRTLAPASLREGNGGELYVKAMEDYPAKRETYERLVARFDLQQALALPGVQSVLEARRSERARLFDDQLDAAAGYGTRPGVEALHKIGGICGRIATEYASRKQFELAEPYLDAQFMLGLHLFEQRMSRSQLSAGLGLMAHSATLRAKILGSDSEAAARYNEFLKSYQGYYREQIEPMERVITSVDPKVQSRHIGDVFVIAQQSNERVWRIEGTLKLGMYKFFHNTAGDRRAAVRLLERLALDPDPAIALAARNASELTIEQYRTLGSR